jgi:hypothetical protein
VDKKVVRMVDTAADVAEVFETAERLTFRSMDLSLGLVSVGLSKQAEIDALRRETNAFLKSASLSQLELRGWKLRSQLGSFLSALQRGRREVPFENEFSDRNSIAFFAIFLRRVVKKSEASAEYSVFKLHLPSQSSSQTEDPEDRFEDFAGQQFQVHANAEGFLRVNLKMLVLIARLIAEGADPSSWVRPSSPFLSLTVRPGGHHAGSGAAVHEEWLGPRPCHQPHEERSSRPAAPSERSRCGLAVSGGGSAAEGHLARELETLRHRLDCRLF